MRPAPGEICRETDRRWLLTAAIIASGLGFIDGSVVAIAAPAIRSDLAASLAQAQWIHNAYMLTLSALILLGGALADRYGLVRIFGLGIAGFVATSLLCAIAPTAGILILARGLQGITAALMVPGSLALITAAYPPDRRGAAIGVWASASAVTAALGPVLGGWLLSFGGDGAWRLIFAINLPLGLFALWVLHARSRDETERSPTRIDRTGAALAVLGLGLVAWALTASEHGGAAGLPAGWIGLAGCLALAAFLIVEARAAQPMMPLHLFRSRVFSVANLVTLLLYFALSAILFFLPMALVAGWRLDELTISAAFLPLTICVSLFSGMAGRWADRVGPGRPIAIGSLIVATAYAALAAGFDLGAFWVWVMPMMTLMGFGMGLVVAPLSTAVMGAVPDSSTGIASGINNAVARMAGLVAVAAMGPVAVLAYQAAGGSLSFGEPGQSPTDAAATNAAFSGIAWAMAALSAVAAALAAFGMGLHPDVQASTDR